MNIQQLPPHPSFFFFFNDTATTEIYTLSLHDALPIWLLEEADVAPLRPPNGLTFSRKPRERDRKSTRLNSSHSQISYAVFCLKKKKKIPNVDLGDVIIVQHIVIVVAVVESSRTSCMGV